MWDLHHEHGEIKMPFYYIFCCANIPFSGNYLCFSDNQQRKWRGWLWTSDQKLPIKIRKHEDSVYLYSVFCDNLHDFFGCPLSDWICCEIIIEDWGTYGISAKENKESSQNIPSAYSLLKHQTCDSCTNIESLFLLISILYL